MGWWSNHPMAGDEPLDCIGDLKEFILFTDLDLSEDPDAWEEAEKGLRERLLSLTPEMKEQIRDRFLGDRFAYAIPYVFVREEAFDVTEDVKELLKDLLRSSIATKFAEDCPIYEFDSDDFKYGNLLGLDVPIESSLYFIYWQQLFLDHFDEIFKGEYSLPEDIGLIATAESRGKNREESAAAKDELRELLSDFRFYLDGWDATLSEFATEHNMDEHRDAFCRFFRALAEHGDRCAQELIAFDHYNIKPLFLTTREDIKFILFCWHELLYNANKIDNIEEMLMTYDCCFILYDPYNPEPQILDLLRTDANAVEQLSEILVFLGSHAKDLNSDEDWKSDLIDFPICLCFTDYLPRIPDIERAEKIVDKFIIYPFCKDSFDSVDCFVFELDNLDDPSDLDNLYGPLFFIRYWIKRNYDLGMKMVHALAEIFDDNYKCDGFMDKLWDETDGIPRADLIGAAIQALTECNYANDSDQERGEWLVSCLTALVENDPFLVSKNEVLTYRGEGGDVVIPADVTFISYGAFFGKELTSVTIHNSVTFDLEAFRECELNDVIIGSGATSIGGVATFSACKRLSSITVAEGNTTYHSEGNCLIETAKNSLILGCKTSVIPAGVISIDREAFCGCDELTFIAVPNTVTKIGEAAFAACIGLTSIDYNGTKAQWAAIDKGEKWDVNAGDYIVHCVDGDIEKA